MKHFTSLLLLLGMSAGTLTAQDPAGNNTNKWVISTANMKGVLGRLNTTFPADVEWSILIKATDDKFITSRSGFSKHGPSYDLAPGMYNFRLNTITVENVPIERGKATRLKAGYLNIVSEGHWEIYNEAKQKLHTTGNKPKKIALPVGNYQLKLGGAFFPVNIKDGEAVGEDGKTVDDYTAIAQKGNAIINASVIALDKVNNKVIARQTDDGLVFVFLSDNSGIKLLSAGNEIKADYSNGTVTSPGGTNIAGRFATPLTSAIDFRIELEKIDAALIPNTINGVNRDEKMNIQELSVINPKGQPPNALRGCCIDLGQGVNQIVEFRLAQGMSVADIGMKVYTYNNLVIAEKAIPNVKRPILAYLITSYYVDSSGYGTGIVKNSNNLGGNIKARPNTSETDRTNSRNATDKWVISTANMKGVLGRLNTAFPADVEWSIEVRAASDDKFITSRSGFSKHGPAYDLAPGMYNFRLNSITVENVPIERGKATRLKAGYLNIVS
ncbi:MAG: hypothetical protein ABR502_10775, partial [Chitinophagaceae bacterium]